MNVEPFRTIVSARANPRPIELEHVILSIGSCFAETMGTRLLEHHFRVCLNPTGILYNPLSIANVLERICSGAPYTESELELWNGRWISLDHHGRFSRPSKEACLEAINTRLAQATRIYRQLDTLMLTFGTAYAWFLKENGRLVANCHQLPQSHFIRRLLSIEEIVLALTRPLEALYQSRPHLNVIVSVSPVRHLREDAHQNCVSKAYLVAALHQLSERFPHLYYFPAYEIMMDDLRDYRFYAPDMSHPGEVAEGYIWHQLVKACLSKRARRFIDAMGPVRKAMQHRVRDPASVSTRRFASEQCKRIDKIEKDFSPIMMREERRYFQALQLGQEPQTPLACAEQYPNDCPLLEPDRQ